MTGRREGLLPDWRVTVPLLVCLLVVLLLAFLVFRFFLLTLTVAASVAMMLAPAQDTLTTRLRGRRSIAAALLVLLCTLTILVPVIAYGALLGQEAVAVFGWLRPRVEPQAFERYWTVDFPARFPLAAAWIRESGGGNSMAVISGALARLAAAANDFLQAFLVGLAQAFFDMIIFLMMVFFLLRDGDHLREALRGISPFTRGQETELVDHLTRTMKGALQTLVVVPVVQGVVALPGFVYFGVPAPVVWSVAVVFSALLPMIGTPIVWIPAGVYLIVAGRTPDGVGMLVYGTLVIASIDNIIKPLILKGAAQIHTLLGFLASFGGLYAFGLKGLVAGPVILSLVLSAYRIYRYDVLRWRQLPGPHPEDRPATLAAAPAGPSR